MLLSSALLTVRAWSGSLDALVDRANALARKHAATASGEHVPESTRWLVKDYRTARILSAASGKSYYWMHLVQLLTARWLVHRGMQRLEVAQLFAAKDPAELLDLFAMEPGTLSSGSPDPASDVGNASADLDSSVLAIRLLAGGLVAQYARARDGEVMTQDVGLDRSLARALALLSAEQVVAGQPDSLGSVHNVVAQCTRPLDERWGIRRFGSSAFPYRGLRLLDEDARLPTLDCVELASGASSELDLREQMAFSALRHAADLCAADPARAYSALREFVVRHPTTTAAEMRDFARAQNVLPAQPALMSWYSQPQPHHLQGGRLYLCRKCGCPMRASSLSGHVRCTVKQCERYDRPHPHGPDAVDSTDRLIALPHVVAYWIGPGLDEMAVYDAASKAQLDPVLYPGFDACDVSLDGGTTGIDLKSHSSPFLLAEALNRSLGRFALYAKRIVAINAQSLAAFPGFLEVARQEYRGALAIEIVSVRELIKRLGATQ